MQGWKFFSDCEVNPNLMELLNDTKKVIYERCFAQILIPMDAKCIHEDIEIVKSNKIIIHQIQTNDERHVIKATSPIIGNTQYLPFTQYETQNKGFYFFTTKNALFRHIHICNKRQLLNQDNDIVCYDDCHDCY